MNNRVRLVPMWAKAVLVLALIGGLVAFQLTRTLPAVSEVRLAATRVITPGTAPSIPWPDHGAAAIAVADVGLVGTSGDAGPAPIASIAKVMTAMLVLADKPLRLHEAGPLITITPEDVASYQRRQAAGESVVKVASGEQLSEYQALQGLLIPSGNNLAELLAKWVAGSVDAFVVQMNQKAKALGLRKSTFADTSGVNPQTASTPSDLIGLGQAAMRDPVFAEIVAQVQAELPVAGIVYNVDSKLGQHGLVGIKTGSSDAAHSCFLFAAKHQLGSTTVVIYGAVMGQDTLEDAFKLTLALVDAARPGIQTLHVFSEGQAVARYETRWGSRSDIVASRDVDIVSYSGVIVTVRLALPTLRVPSPKGADAGNALLSANGRDMMVTLRSAAPLALPSWTWRVTRLG